MALNYQSARDWIRARFSEDGDSPERKEWFHSENGQTYLDEHDSLVTALTSAGWDMDEASDFVAERLSSCFWAAASEYGD